MHLWRKPCLHARSFQTSFSMSKFLSLLNILTCLVFPLHTLEFFLDHLLVELFVTASNR